MDVTCPAPEFVWLGHAWSFCVRCDRAAWSHEQADPLADVRNKIDGIQRGLGAEHYPPTMRPVDDAE